MISGEQREYQNKVQVWIYFQNQGSRQTYFLILKTLPGRGGFWQPVTGSVEKGEDLEDAALREAQEETGLHFSQKPSGVGKSFEFESVRGPVREYGFAVQARFDSKQGDELDPSGLPVLKLDGHEHSEYRWVLLEEALSLIRFPSNADVLKAVSERLKAQS